MRTAANRTPALPGRSLLKLFACLVVFLAVSVLHSSTASADVLFVNKTSASTGNPAPNSLTWNHPNPGGAQTILIVSIAVVGLIVSRAGSPPRVETRSQAGEATDGWMAGVTAANRAARLDEASQVQDGWSAYLLRDAPGQDGGDGGS